MLFINLFILYFQSEGTITFYVRNICKLELLCITLCKNIALAMRINIIIIVPLMSVSMNIDTFILESLQI